MSKILEKLPVQFGSYARIFFATNSQSMSFFNNIYLRFRTTLCVFQDFLEMSKFLGKFICYYCTARNISPNEATEGNIRDQELWLRAFNPRGTNIPLVEH